MASGGFYRERVKRGSRNFTRLSGIISLTNLPDITSLAASVGCKMQLNTAQKCVKLARRKKSRIIRPLFSIESPNLARTSRPTYYTAASDMTPPAASVRQLSKFKKAENAASDGFGSNFSGAAFGLANQLVGSAFQLQPLMKRLIVTATSSVPKEHCRCT